EAAQNLLRQSLPPMHNLPDAATVARVRDLVRSPTVQSALGRSSDTFLVFALRAVEHVVADQSQTDRETISRLWDPAPEPSLRAPAELSHHVRAKSVDCPGVNGLYRVLTLACTRFRRHRVRCFDGAGGGSWRDGSLRESSSLRLYA